MEDEYRDILRIISGILPPILTSLETLGFIARYLHPPHLPHLMTQVEDPSGLVNENIDSLDDVAWPEALKPIREKLLEAATASQKAFERLHRAANNPGDILSAYGAIRQSGYAQAALYPLAHMMPPVSWFFLEPEYRSDQELITRLQNADPDPQTTGILHANNDQNDRGGFSLYVPEYADPETPMPLIFALHGGNGHGRDFLWSWLRTARSVGAIVVSPTSLGETWGLMDAGPDVQNLTAILEHVKSNWTIDDDHLLLTGMSDGGTFSYIAGMETASPFTHMAPISASFHPLLAEAADSDRLRDLPIHITHGNLDWMFPASIASEAARALSACGANVVHNEIEDLSHTYPREENLKIFRWMMSG